jgi:alkylation response protein AidB-like acyl-CoA dehydrogenase
MLPDVTRPHPAAHDRTAQADGGAAADEGPPTAGSRAGAPRETSIAVQLRRMLQVGDLDLPMPAAGHTARRWAALAGWGGRDLSLARLAEGHVDALAILTEAGRPPVPGALYGVWASRSGGATVRLERRRTSFVLTGTMRFCSGARVLDRALVVADPADGSSSSERLLVDVDAGSPGVEPEPDSWCTAAMADADTLDVVFREVAVVDADLVGPPGWYVARPGFALGGAGVAAVWWGGAAGVLDRVLGHLRPVPDAHQLAHIGELHTALAASDALLGQTAAAVDEPEIKL